MKEREEYENEKKTHTILFFLIWSYQKDTLGLLNHRRNNKATEPS